MPSGWRAFGPRALQRRQYAVRVGSDDAPQHVRVCYRQAAATDACLLTRCDWATETVVSSRSTGESRVGHEGGAAEREPAAEAARVAAEVAATCESHNVPPAPHSDAELTPAALLGPLQHRNTHAALLDVRVGTRRARVWCTLPSAPDDELHVRFADGAASARGRAPLLLKRRRSQMA